MMGLRNSKCLVVAGILMVLANSAVLQGAGVPSQPYTPDEHTLFLHHFNGNTERGGFFADFARGSNVGEKISQFEYKFIEGKFGKGLACPESDSISEQSRPGVRFRAPDNYSPMEGTIEFFFCPFFNGNETGIVSSENSPLRVFWETRGGDQRISRLVIGKGSFNSARTGAKNNTLFADIRDGQLGLLFDVSGWRAGEWHHVAFIWDDHSAKLLVDGIRVAEGKRPSSLMGDVSDFEVGYQAHGIIDELRISDIKREELEVGNKVTEITQSKN